MLDKSTQNNNLSKSELKWFQPDFESKSSEDITDELLAMQCSKIIETLSPILSAQSKLFIIVLSKIYEEICWWIKNYYN